MTTSDHSIALQLFEMQLGVLYARFSETLDEFISDEYDTLRHAIAKQRDYIDSGDYAREMKDEAYINARED